MTVIRFFVPGIPTAKGRPRLGKRRTFTPAKTKRAEATFVSLSVSHAPPEPFAGPLALEVGFVFPIPGSWPKWKQAAAWRHVTKPDLDNLVKLAKDAMTGIFWLDDKQVVEVRASKRYGSRPGTAVRLEVLAQAKR